MTQSHQEPMWLQRSTCYTCLTDNRFGYHVYIPQSLGTPQQPDRYPLAVLVHGSERAAEGYRNRFKRFADETGTAILAPLFPAGIHEPDRIDNYNLLRYRDIDYDTVLLHMVEECAARFPVDGDRLLLHGFSSGGQFALRFFYLYPHRLQCVSIGAPGAVTLPDPKLSWPDGMGGMDSVFGRQPKTADLRDIPVQIVVGELDNEPSPALPTGRLGLNRALCGSLRDLGVNVRLDEVPEAGHNGFLMLDQIMDFFRSSNG